MDAKTVTQKNSPEGYIVLTLIRNNQEFYMRFRITQIESYTHDTKEQQFNFSMTHTPIGSYVRMASGIAWSVKESPEEIDKLIDTYEVPPFRCHSPAGRFFG